jgi:hypothetical protein
MKNFKELILLIINKIKIYLLNVFKLKALLLEDSGVEKFLSTVSKIKAMNSSKNTAVQSLLSNTLNTTLCFSVEPLMVSYVNGSTKTRKYTSSKNISHTPVLIAYR